MNPRQQQLSLYYNNQAVIAQDQELIDFCVKHQVSWLTLHGDPDLDYFSKNIPNCKVTRLFPRTSKFMMAKLFSYPYLVLENFVSDLGQQASQHSPDWIYVAVNKYIVTTQQQWTDLTDDYDNDLLNIIAKALPGYKEIKRHSCFDHGQYFNFVHPSTYVYFERS